MLTARSVQVPKSTTSYVDASVSTLRAELASWITRARAGEEVVVTDRGVPVARLLAIDAAPLIERLTREGVLSRPRRPDRPQATGAARVPAHRSVAELVSDQRR